MRNPDVRLIVTDLDGTFLGEKSSLIPQNALAFQAARAEGLHVAIASGRLARVCSRIAMELHLDACHIIGMNGAQIYRTPFGDRVMETFFSDALRDACFSVIREAGCRYNLYTGRAVYTNQKMSSEREARYRDNFSGCGVRVVVSPDAFEQSKGEPCVKILFKPDGDLAAYERARQELSKIREIYLTSSSATNTEVMRAGTGKAQAVRLLADMLGISMRQVMCFGDYENDIEMLRACGVSVAMGNGAPSAKEAAKYVTKKNTEAGVAFAIDALLNGSLDKLRK